MRPLKPEEFQEEALKLIKYMHGTRPMSTVEDVRRRYKLLYETANIRIELKHDQVWTYGVWIRGQPVDVNGYESTYNGIISLVTVVLLDAIDKFKR